MKFLQLLLKKTKTWKDIEYFDEQWKERIYKMSSFIEQNETVMDLGCGKMWLKNYLSSNNKYIPVDYIKRDKDCLVKDFNKREFPDVHSDVIFASGVLEYIDNPKWFIENISKISDKCILSYCTTQHFPNIDNRKALKWVNHYSFEDIKNLFEKNEMSLTNSLTTERNNTIFIFKKLKNE